MAQHTNKRKLKKGLKYLAGSLPLAFLGPSVVYSAFGNQDKFLYIPVLIIGFLIIIAAAYCMFKGIRTIVAAVFDG